MNRVLLLLIILGTYTVEVVDSTVQTFEKCVAILFWDIKFPKSPKKVSRCEYMYIFLHSMTHMSIVFMQEENMFLTFLGCY